MRLVVIYAIDDDIDATCTDPHEVVDAIEMSIQPCGSIADAGKLEEPFLDKRYRFVSAEWEDSARSMIDDLLPPSPRPVDNADYD